jgi:hypothetical protein
MGSLDRRLLTWVSLIDDREILEAYRTDKKEKWVCFKVQSMTRDRALVNRPECAQSKLEGASMTI